MVRCKIPAPVLNRAITDLSRRHPFAHERVGFFLAGLARSNSALLILVRDYLVVADDDYQRAHGVGAMMGPGAIRKAQERALFNDDAIFHVHLHGGTGLPSYSDVDLSEYPKFVPDFSKVARKLIHGAIVLSGDQAIGLYWRDRRGPSAPIDTFSIVGPHLLQWSAA